MSPIKRYLFILLVLAFSTPLLAQQVIYSPPIDTRSTVQFQLSGKTSKYYWLWKEKRAGNRKAFLPEKNFEVYDSRLRLVNSFSEEPLPSDLLKEYQVAGNHYFDRIFLVKTGYGVAVILRRYLEDGSTSRKDSILFEFPFQETGNAFLVSRSEDQSKILLLGFEPVSSASPKLHALLFDDNWQLLSNRTFQHPAINQPLIQDDPICYPIEYYNSQPLQIANNGQWLMAAPSRNSNHFLLFHFFNDDRPLSFKEMGFPSFTQLSDVSLSIDNQNGEAFAGLISKFRFPALKHVEVVHYSMAKQQFDFDSSYRFNTLPGNQMRNDHLVNERFVSVPGKGFLLLKEYGRSFMGYVENLQAWDPEFFFASASTSSLFVQIPTLVNGYTHFSKLGIPAGEHQRGDLNMFFFPAEIKDSCWSGLIYQPQTNEMNSPNLSYLLIPAKDKLVLLYNSFYDNGQPIASSTYIDHQGNILNQGGVIFWKYKTELHFQEARQIEGNEVVIPYNDNQRSGFAIVQLH